MRNGEAAYDDVVEEISTEISGSIESDTQISEGNESEEEEEVALPDKRSSIFMETETRGVHEGLVYEKWLGGTITKPPSVWPSAERIREMIG